MIINKFFSILRKYTTNYEVSPNFVYEKYIKLTFYVYDSIECRGARKNILHIL